MDVKISRYDLEDVIKNLLDVAIELEPYNAWLIHKKLGVQTARLIKALPDEPLEQTPELEAC